MIRSPSISITYANALHLKQEVLYTPLAYTLVTQILERLLLVPLGKRQESLNRVAECLHL